MKAENSNRIRRYILTTALLSTPIQANESKDSQTLKSLELRIEEEGPQTVLSDVFGKPEWNSIIEGIKKAKPRWLRVGMKLRKVSDAGASEELRISLAEGLEVNPVNVFRNALFESDSGQISMVCRTTGIERPLAVEISSVDKRILEIRKIKIRDLEKFKTVCLEALEAEKIGLQELQRNEVK